MSSYLIALLTVMCCVIILTSLFGIVVFRKISITAKKIDYLIEDLTYKAETLSPVVDSLLKLSTYVDVLDVVVTKNSNILHKVVISNSENIKKFNTQLEEALKNARI